MLTSEDFATASHRQREREVLRNLERRRLSAERREAASGHPVHRRGLRLAAAAWIGRLHSGQDHHVVRS